MAFDGISAHFLAQEFKTLLLDKRIMNIYQIDQHTLCVQFYGNYRTQNLLISINPSRAFIYLASSPPKKHKKQSTFALLLKKQLVNSKLLKLENLECERIFNFTFEGTNDIGDHTQFVLVAEIMGRHSNLILLYPNGIIYDAFHHVDSSINRYREVMPARHYVTPPEQDNYMTSDYPKLIENHCSCLFRNLTLDLEKEKIERYLLKLFAGFSPLLVREIMFRSGLQSNKKVSELTKEEIRAIEHASCSLLEEIQTGITSPKLYYLDDNLRKIIDFHIMPLQQFSHSKRCISYNEALDKYFTQKQREDQLHAWQQRATTQLTRLQKRNARKMILHEQDYQEGLKQDQYKLYGDLLQVKIYQIPPKSTFVDVENYYDENSSLVRIPLDPALSPSDNVERYYNLYRKAQEKTRRAKALLVIDEQNLEWLDNLQTMLDNAEEPADIIALVDEMNAFQEGKKKKQQAKPDKIEVPLGQIINPGRPGKKGKFKPQSKRQFKKKTKTTDNEQPTHGFREYKTSDGFIVKVGRNNIENDRLTFRKARKDDLWFHARQIPGSHTVLELNGKEPSDTAIEEAAQIAAYFSSANKTKSGTKVDVDYCLIKHVTKIPKAKPGLVNYSNHKTCYVSAVLPRES